MAMALLMAGLLMAALPSRQISAEGSSEPRLEKSSPRLARLVVELGHETWSRREAAQDSLLEQRRAVTLLRDALESDNLELAYRARYVLDRLDPLLGHFQIVKIRLGGAPRGAPRRAPRVTAIGYTSGKTREELVLETRELLPSGRGTRSSFQYSIFFGTFQDRGLEILVNRSIRGYSSSVTLSTPLRDDSAISLLARTEECHYEQFGVRLERERQRYLTLVRVRYGRASELKQVELPPDPANLLHAILEELLSQAGSRVPATRAAAIEILSYLAPGGHFVEEQLAEEAREAFTAAKEVPALRPLAILGLDLPKELHELVVSEASLTTSQLLPASQLPPPRIRAAARLLERGDATHLPFLVDRLTQDNPEHLHFTMAGIADFVEAHRRAANKGPSSLAEDTRALLIRKVFSDRFFSHAVWQNRETEYFIDCMSALLDPEVAEDVTILEESLERLEGLVSGTSGSVRLRLPVCQPIWRRMAARLSSPPSERSMLFRLLPSMMSGGSISQPLLAVGEALKDEPLTEPEFRALLDTLLEHRKTNLPSTAKLLVEVLRSIRWKEGQLRPLVAAALEVTAQLTSTSSTSTRSTTSLFRPIADRLNLLTGVSVPRTSTDVKPWKSWLEDDVAVRKQEKKLIALQESRPDTGPPLLFIEFDLLVKNSSAGFTRGSAPSEFDLVDGRVVEVREGEQVSYRDRWGNTVTRRLRETKQLIRTMKSTSRLSTKPRRYRFDNARLLMTVGIPVFSVMSGRDVRSAWVETSAFFLGSRSLRNRSTSSYRTVALLTEFTKDRPPPNSTPSTLWDWFLETHLLKRSGDASLTLMNAVTRILRTLKIEGSGPALLEIFDRQPNYQLARDLYTVFGERRGIEYYRTQLPSLTGSRRLNAARMLAEVGEIEGVDALLKDESRASLISLGLYLQLASTVPDQRERVLDFLVGRLKFDSVRDEPDARIIFAALRRETNDDFGFTTAIGTNDDQEKMAKIRKAIEDARSWRQETSSTPPARTDDSR